MFSVGAVQIRSLWIIDMDNKCLQLYHHLLLLVSLESVSQGLYFLELCNGEKGRENDIYLHSQFL